MVDKYQELQDRLAMVAFLIELLALEDPFKKGVHGEGGSRAKVVAAFKEFAQKMKDHLLEEQAKEDDSLMNRVEKDCERGIFTDDEVLVLKAWAAKMMTKPEIQKILHKPSESPPAKRSSSIRVLPQSDGSINRIGKFGKVIDIEDAQGAVGGNVDAGSRFSVIAKHSVQGYYECASVDANGTPTGIRFLIHDSLPDWED